MSQVTLQSIADRLGVSKYAVSRALAGKSGVSEETRRLVVRTAGQLGYVARADRRSAPKPSRTTRRIQVVFRDHANSNRELWIAARDGVEMEAARYGLAVQIEWTDDAEHIRRLASDALGFVMVGPHDHASIDAVRQAGVASVAITHVLPPLCEMDQIIVADAESGDFAARFLADLGHRTVAYVHGLLGFPGRELRLQGVREAAASIKGFDVQEISFPDDYTGAGLGPSLVALSRRGINPTAFFCGSDGVAITVISELTRLGVRVPQDVSVVGHADYPVAKQISPQLTTIHVHYRETGMAAVRLLRARAGIGEMVSTLPYQRIALVPYLVERESTGPMKKIDWKKALVAK
jgi:LacI family transcriptional regulator